MKIDLIGLIKRGAGLSLVSALSSGLSLASVFWLVYWYGASLSGVFFTVLSFILLINRLVVINPWQAVIRLVGEGNETNKSESLSVYSQAWLIDIFSALVGGLILFLIAQGLFSDDLLMHDVILVMLIFLLKTNGSFVGLLRVTDSIIYPNIAKLVSEVVKIFSLTIVFIAGVKSLTSIFIVFFVVELTYFTLLLIKSKKNIRKHKLEGFNIKSGLKFNGFLFNYAFLANLNGSLVGSIKMGDEALLSFFAEDYVVSIYKLIKSFSAIVGLATDPLQILLFPDLVKNIKTMKPLEVRAHFLNFTFLFSLVFIVVIIMSYFVWPIVLGFVLDSVDDVYLNELLVMLSAVIIQVAFFYLQPILMAKDKVKDILKINIIGLLVYIVPVLIMNIFIPPLLSVVLGYFLFSAYSVSARWLLVGKLSYDSF